MQAIPSDRANKHTFWQRQVIQFQRSGVPSAAQFCRDQGLPYQSFMNWQKKLEGEPALPAVAPKSFVKIQPSSPPITQRSSITCKLPNGIEVSWNSTVPAATIAAVLQEVSPL